MVFKNRKKQTLYWDVHFYDTSEKFDIKFEDYCKPVSKMLPFWWKDSDKNVTRKGSVKGCPSFQELFTNSFIYYAPCDFKIIIENKNIFIDALSQQLLRSDTHTFNFGSSKFNQMGPYWDQNLLNLKLGSNIRMQAKEEKIRAIFLPAYFHKPNPILQIPPGVLDILPNRSQELNLNTFIDTSNFSKFEKKTITIRHEEPLAMLYFPDGLPKMENKKMKSPVRKKEHLDYLGDWQEYEKSLDKKSKCPFRLFK